MRDEILRASFSSLVKRAGGVEAVAALLEEQFGSCSKGTVSKMCSGAMSVTVEAAWAVEDFVGHYPITNRGYERTSERERQPACLRELAALSAAASGIAHAAMIQAVSPNSPGGEEITAKERAELLTTVRAARQTLTDIIEAAEHEA